MAMEWITAIDKRYANCFPMFLTSFACSRQLLLTSDGFPAPQMSLPSKAEVLSGNVVRISFSVYDETTETNRMREHKSPQIGLAI